MALYEDIDMLDFQHPDPMRRRATLDRLETVLSKVDGPTGDILLDSNVRLGKRRREEHEKEVEKCLWTKRVEKYRKFPLGGSCAIKGCERKARKEKKTCPMHTNHCPRCMIVLGTGTRVCDICKNHKRKETKAKWNAKRKGVSGAKMGRPSVSPNGSLPVHMRLVTPEERERQQRYWKKTSAVVRLDKKWAKEKSKLFTWLNDTIQAPFLHWILANSFPLSQETWEDYISHGHLDAELMEWEHRASSFRSRCPYHIPDFEVPIWKAL